MKVKNVKPAIARLAQYLALQMWPLVRCYVAHTHVHLQLKDPQQLICGNFKTQTQPDR